MALIIAPTRELVMQIVTVIKEISSTCTEYCRIEVVTIIGGMSEQKQKRLLSYTLKRPVHIIVATPGRLHEMIFENDIELTIFHDMARLRYLVVDEVDRIMEEGHFNELHRIFSRIREHEQFCDEGKIPIVESINRQLGITVDDMNNNDEKPDENVDEIEGDDEWNDGNEDGEENEVGEKFDETMPGFDPLPSLPDMPIDDDIQALISKLPPYIPQQRQTLVFSATANQKQVGDDRKRKRIKGIGEGPVRSLPRSIQE